MTEQAKVPEIRFAGFTDPWEQRKFSELASLRRGLTYSPADIRPYGQGIRVLRSSNIDEDEFTLSNEDVFVDETVVGIELVQEGEILITAANGSPRLVGKRAIINGLTGKTVHGGFMLCAHAEQPDYVAALMGSRWYQHFLATGVAGGNGSIGNLDKAALEDEFAFVPSIEEQELIGVLFSRLDDLITLHQRKYDKLVVFKKSMLEKMFPKDGESVPEIRFAGFTDPWEQRKLGELSSEFQSGDFISAEKILASGPYPVYGGNGLRGYAKRYNHDGFYALIGRQGALCGNVNTAVGKAYFTEHAVAIKANSLHDTRFLVHLLRCMDLGQYSGQSAQPGLAVGVLKEVETTVPSKVEQQAIGSFFSRLDDLITLHQRKLELLQNIKKSLLDKMFA